MNSASLWCKSFVICHLTLVIEVGVVNGDGINWYDWNTMPTMIPRNLVSQSSLRDERFTPFSEMDPDVGVSNPAMSPRRVDFPLPEGPTTARNCPLGTSRLTSFRMFTGRPPLTSRMDRFRTWITQAPQYSQDSLQRTMSYYTLAII